MTLNRFEAWWNRNPERRELSGSAKELARSIWNAAQEDLADDMPLLTPRVPSWQNDVLSQPLSRPSADDKEKTC